ncbi:MAG: NB-ARC domain-containing protein, partial [Elainellaceae cyanobacterium]
MLQDLHTQLQGEQPVAVTAVAGMGGIGKTELAIRYALGYWQAHYPAGVCWLRCRGAEMASQVVEFATVEMGLVVPDGLTAEQQVRWCWRNWRPAGAVLVVLDDVTDYGAIADYLPPVDLRFRVLMTTRSQQLGASVRTVPLDLLSPEAALELLAELEGAGRVMTDRAAAAELCDRLGNLPLGVELVGRYLRQKRNLSLEKMLERLENKGLRHRSLAERSPDMTGRRGVEAAIALSWEELQREETRRLAYLLSLFALAPIPWGLVAGCLPDEDEEELEDARDRLVNLSLVRRVDEGVYQLHQLVR